MTRKHPASPAQEAAFLRAEARFAVIAGGFIMVLGFLGVIVLVGLSLNGLLSPLAPAAFGAGPIVIGWGGLTYGSWRYEQAAAIMQGRRPRQRKLAEARKAIAQSFKKGLARAARGAARLIKGAKG